MIGRLGRPANERGQVLPLLGIMVIAMLAVVVVVVDLGFLFGQRRFDQNGADAAALAAGQLLASRVVPRDYSGNEVYFNVEEWKVYQLVRAYAGLNPNVTYPARPVGTATGVNQNPLLRDRSPLAVTLEYWDGVQWCYSPSMIETSMLGNLSAWLPRYPDVKPCVLPYAIVGGQKIEYPPHPKSGPYKVRVTVSTTTEHFIAQAIGIGNTAPAKPPSDTDPACLPVPGAAGSTTCAHAVVAVKGRLQAAGRGHLVPVTTAACQIGAGAEGKLFELWGDQQQPACVGDVSSSWPSVLDLTSEDMWCNDPSGGSSSNPDYKFFRLLPDTVSKPFARAECQKETVTDLKSGLRWDREGFVPDSAWPGTGRSDNDVAGWIARGFGGTVVADPKTGNKLPVYMDANPGQGGNLGNNIANGFYCNSNVTGGTSSAVGDECPINPANTYFFAPSKVQKPCPDPYGAKFPNVGCRDAMVPAYDQPEVAEGVEGGGQDGKGGTYWRAVDSRDHNVKPDRVRVVRILRMRLYCQGDGQLCTDPPKDIVGNASHAEVFGLFLGEWDPDCPECKYKPSPYGNTAVLER